LATQHSREGRHKQQGCGRLFWAYFGLCSPYISCTFTIAKTTYTTTYRVCIVNLTSLAGDTRQSTVQVTVAVYCPTAANHRYDDKQSTSTYLQRPWA
jgi:hypothetical protein